MAGSANAFLSAMLLLAVVMYIFGILFMQAFLEYLSMEKSNQSVTIDLLADYFGSVPDTFWTLLLSITGGHDWELTSQQLHAVHWSYKWAFGAYIMFTSLCVLNILNGVFVSVAIESAQTNKELAIASTQYKTRQLVNQMLEWFREADKDMSGKVTWEELQHLLKDDTIRAHFSASGIDTSSAGQIFQLLDKDRTGDLDAVEFVNNLIGLQGGARSVDLKSLRLLCDDMHDMLASALDSQQHMKAAIGIEPHVPQ